jgi:hypothetical protein
MMGTILYRLPAYNLCLRGDIASSLLTVSIAEGLILQLDPSFDIVSQALPYFPGQFSSVL